MIAALSAQQMVAGNGGAVHHDLHRWLDELRRATNLALPPKEIRTFSLSASDVSSHFEASGKGKKGAPYYGWAICNGQNGTPDLRDRFIRCVDDAAGGTGGSDSSAHTHSVDPASVTSGLPSSTIEVQAGLGETVAKSTHTHTVDVAATTSGAASATDNRPAFYELVALMRLEVA